MIAIVVDEFKRMRGILRDFLIRPTIWRSASLSRGIKFDKLIKDNWLHTRWEKINIKY